MPSPKVASATSILQLIERFDDFKGDFSFDAMFENMVNELLSAFLEEDADATEGGPIGTDALSNGHIRAASDAAKLPSGAVTGTPLLPAVDDLLGLFKDSRKELVNLRQKIDVRLQNLKKEVTVEDSKHCKTLAEAGASEKPIVASQEISDVVKDSPHKGLLTSIREKTSAFTGLER